MPQAADEERGNNIAVAPRGAASAAAQRDVNVIFQPAGQADVPTVPQFADGGSQKRLAEVFRQGQAQHLPRPQHDVGVAGEIGVKLEHIQHCAQKQLAAVVGGRGSKGGVDGQRGAVGHGQFFKVAPKAPLCSPLPLAGLWGGGVQLGHQLVIAVEWPLGDGQKKRRKADQPGVLRFRLLLAPADVHQVAGQLQAEIPDAQHLRHAHVPDAQRERLPQQQGGGAQSEQRQRGQCPGQADIEPTGAAAQVQRGLPDQQSHKAEQQAALPIQREVEHEAGRQHQLPAAWLRGDAPKARQ